MRLSRDRSLILVVDVQERLAAAMPPDSLARVEKYGRALARTGRELKIPVLATEQYRKGLGPTVKAILDEVPLPIEKMTFSCAGDEGFLGALAATGRRQIVVAGMETHVCVFQTVRDLVERGFEVHVCADAVASRTEEHRRVGLDLCRQAGAVVTTAETAIFDLLGRAGTPEFKAVAPLLK